MGSNTSNLLRYVKRTIKQLVGLEPNIGIQVNCLKEHHGSEYGGWCVCPSNLNKDSIVYSFGIGKDISFDLSLIRKFGVTVNAFDPTPQSVDWVKSQQLPSQFQLFEYGLADFDGTSRFYPPQNPDYVSHTILERSETSAYAIEVPVYRLETILKKLGHDHIDLLKMDVEGAEYTVIDDLVKSETRVEQLLVEFHHRFKEVDVSQTKEAVSTLNKHGFWLFNISPSGGEYSFIRSDAVHINHQ